MVTPMRAYAWEVSSQLEVFLEDSSIWCVLRGLLTNIHITTHYIYHTEPIRIMIHIDTFYKLQLIQYA